VEKISLNIRGKKFMLNGDGDNEAKPEKCEEVNR